MIEGEVQVKLEKIKYVVMTQLSASLLEGTFDVEFWDAWATEVLTVRVKGFVWGESLGGRTIRYPLNWIEAVKARWAPRWYRRWSPVRYKVHKIEAKAYYLGWEPRAFPDQQWRIAAYVRSLEEEEG